MKGLLLSTFVVLAGLLSGCTSVYLDDLEAHLVSYKSNYRDASDTSTYFICDNRTTYVSYKFYYDGELYKWRSRFVGEKTNATTAWETFYASNYGIHGKGNGTVEVEFVVPIGQAPLGGAVSPQSITPVPNPTVIGETKLQLEVYSLSGKGRLTTPVGIEVIDPCP